MKGKKRKKGIKEPKVLIEPSVSPEEADKLADEIVQRARKFRKVWQEFMSPPKKKSSWKWWLLLKKCLVQIFINQKELINSQE